MNIGVAQIRDVLLYKMLDDSAFREVSSATSKKKFLECV